MLKRLMVFFGFALICLCSSIKAATISNIRVNQLSRTVQYVVDLTGVVPVTQHTYHHPYRRVFSLYHTTLAHRINLARLTNRYVTKVRLQHGKGKILLGLHLSKAYKLSAKFWAPSGQRGIRYVIDVTKKNPAKSTQTTNMTFDRRAAIKLLDKTYRPRIDQFVNEHLGVASKPRQKVHQSQPANSKARKPVSVSTARVRAPASVPQFNEQAQRYSQKIIIVIDPGHGGKDPGATGPRGHHEKKVVLAIAKCLQQQINSYRGFRAVLTRGDDRYLTLRYRLALARKYHGDMFVAIHADAFINTSARGASVFALSQRGATSEAARWLAQRENQSELMGGVDLADKDRTLRSVLIDLSQTATIGASLKIGSGIIQNLKAVVPMHARRVEQAAFVVLKSPDIPSLLIETGFISNPTEEQQLILHTHQKKVAKAIAQGIVQYFRAHPPRGSWLAKQASHL